MLRSIIILTSIAILGCETQRKSTPEGYPISSANIGDVTLTDSFWLPKIKLIQDSTIPFAFQKCEEEGRMENFLIAGKKISGVARGKMPFDDTDLYKIIEGAALTLVSLPNPKLDAYLDSIISIIEVGQEPDGYLTTWFTIDRTKPPASWVKPSTERWENEISSHELYNSGHLFEAAAAHYWATGKKDLLNIAIKNADLLVLNFKPGKLHRPPGHQIVETGLIKLYTITRNPEYLKLSKYFLELRGDSLTHKLYGAYNQDHLPVIRQSEAVGHAVRAEYMYAAMTDIAAIENDSAYVEALNKLWENVVTKKMYVTGGVGAKREGESFGENYELPNSTAYSETCAAIGSVSWNQRMFNLTGDSKYYDIIERTLYNGLISGLSVDGKKFFYPNPLESDGKYTFNMGSCTRQSWFDCSCCPTNLIRFLPSIPGLVYATRRDTAFVNLFISSKAKLKVGRREVELNQQTSYPWKGLVNIVVNTQSNTNFTMMVRTPSWVYNEPVPGNLYTYIGTRYEGTVIKINGVEENVVPVNGYIAINRDWSNDDNITIEFPMRVHKVKATSLVNDNLNKVAFEFGPIVYCAEEFDNPEIDKFLLPTDIDVSVNYEDFLNSKVNVIKGRYQNTELKLIPYYLWSNRGVGKMKVWLPEK